MTDLRAALGAQRLAAEQKRHVHRYDNETARLVPRLDDPTQSTWVAVDFCRCGAARDPIRSKRGRTARQRGNSYERSVAARLGALRVGQYGGREDVAGDWIIVQCKNGGVFPERIWRWLQALPANADQLRAVVIGDAPGAGTKRREVIVLDLADFIEWFGNREDAA